MLWLAVFTSVKCWLLLLPFKPVCCGWISWEITPVHWPMYLSDNTVKHLIWRVTWYMKWNKVAGLWGISYSLSPDYPRIMPVDYRITRPTIELGSLLRGVINIHTGAVASLGATCTERMGLLWRITQKPWCSQKSCSCIHLFSSLFRMRMRCTLSFKSFGLSNILK